MTVGYGNHEAPGSGQAPKPGETADAKTASAKPDAGAADRPGMDLGGTGSDDRTVGQTDRGSPALTEANTDEVRAPGSGAFPTDSPPDGETDPATD
jgi:hypothetical protein